MDTEYDFILEETDTDYYCILCGCDVSGYKNVMAHYHGNRHAESLEKYGNAIWDNGDNKYYCDLCDCTIVGYQNVRGHVIGQRHSDFLDGSESEASDDSVQYDALNPGDFIVQQDDCDLLECFLCNFDITDNRRERQDHLQSRRHQKAVKNYGRDILGAENGWYYCQLCDCEISSYKNVYDHLMGKGHQNLMS